MPSLAPLVRPGLIALLLPATLLAQGWVQRTPPSNPTARNNAAAAYDVYRGLTTLFGGQDAATAQLADTWEFNGVTWTPRLTPVRPSGRWGHAMAFDQRRGCVVLFGGYDGSQYRNDTWEWNGFGWTQRTLPSVPPGRGFCSMAFDSARGVCVLFGGAGTAGASLADTWEYDGLTWTQRSAAAAPSPRLRAALAYDEVRRETLLFGGGDGAAVTNELWAWNGTTWSQKSAPTAPPARWDAALAFDGNCGRTVLLGGGDATWASNFGDSWAWDGVAWTQLGGSQPPARHSPVLVHDAQRGQFVGFGGRDATGFRNDTWELAPSCSRTMAVVTPPVVGQTAQFRYDYPAAAGNLHFCWTLVTPRQPAALALPIPGLPTIGLCRVDLFNQLLSPATFLDGSGSLATAIPIPANTAFNGFQFDVQNVDLDFFTLALRWAENDAEVTSANFAAPVANFTASQLSGNAPLTVIFTDTSSNNPTSWQWDFDGDGIIDSSARSPIWTYLNNGAFSVRLTASNGAGSGTLVVPAMIIVGTPNPLLNMMPVAPGAFQMGSAALGQTNEQPVHQVTLTSPFWIGKYEVTQAEYQTVMGSNPSYFQGLNAPNALQRPVEQVSWNSAVAYCQALTATEQAAGRVPAGYQYRLPTEAEWEYCCRAGTTTEWNTGTSLSTSQANFGNALANATYPSGQTAVVGSYAPNAFGLHDMHGNVGEWCLDSFSLYMPGAAIDPFVTGGLLRVARSSHWSRPAIGCRSAYRNDEDPNYSNFDLGFRVALAPALSL